MPTIRTNEWRKIGVKVENTIHLELMALSVLQETMKTVNSKDFETFICYCMPLLSFCSSTELREDMLAQNLDNEAINWAVILKRGRRVKK